MISVVGRRTPVLPLAMLSLVLIAGAVLGASQAADGGERVDIGNHLSNEMLTDDGELKTDRNAAESAQSPVGEWVADRVPVDSPQSPRLEAALEAYVVVPFVKIAIKAAAVGFHVGYVMCSTLGVAVSRLVFNGALIGVFAGVTWHTVGLVRDLREVST